MEQFWKSIPKWLRWLLIFPLLCLNGFLLAYIFSLYKPLFNYLIIASILAFLLKLTIKFLVNRGIKKEFAIAGSIIVSLFLILLLGFTVIPILTEQLINLIGEIPESVKQGSKQIEQLANIPIFVNLGINIDELIAQASTTITNSLSSFGSRFINIIQGTINSVIDSLVILILTIFFLIGEDQFYQGILSWIPAPWNNKIKIYIKETFRDYGR